MSKSSPRMNVTRYAIPVSDDSAADSTIIAAALVYARPTSLPIACPYRRPIQYMRAQMSAVTMISSEMIVDVYAIPSFCASPAK